MDHPRARGRHLLAVVAIALIQLGGTHIAQRGQPGRHQLDQLGYALLLLGPALLLLRNRFPLPVCLGTTAVAGAYLLAGYAYGPVFLSVIVGFVTAVLTGHRRGAWLALTGLYLTLTLTSFRGWQALGLLAWLLLLALAAEVIRNKADQREQRRQARAEREQRIADEQRITIARELHDVLAHSISLINIQAGVALELLDGDPEQARTALTTIKQTSKEALGEVRQVLGTLRTPGSTAPRLPAPGLARLPELISQARTAGLTVTLHTHGTPARCPKASSWPPSASSRKR
ncbi:sensor histidine kinase [Streptacidiphilus sp. PAMC 29251]